jgi:hypothetical protein
LCCVDGMQGNAGDAPTAEELVLALRNHDLFLYFGHGSGNALWICIFDSFVILLTFAYCACVGVI